jgi:hypothetical protein
MSRQKRVTPIPKASTAKPNTSPNRHAIVSCDSTA